VSRSSWSGPDPSEPADDDVVAQPRDVVFHAAPSEVLAQVALGDGLDEDPEVVVDGPHPEQDEDDGERLAPGPSGRTSRKPTVATVVTVW